MLYISSLCSFAVTDTRQSFEIERVSTLKYFPVHPKSESTTCIISPGNKFNPVGRILKLIVLAYREESNICFTIILALK